MNGDAPPPSSVIPLLVVAASVTAAELTIQLTSEGEVARLSTDETAGTMTVTITSSERLSEFVTIGNATFDPEEVQKVILCEGCEETYFIAAHDRSSNYGATIGLVLWPSGCCGMWWSISILPLEVAGIEEPDSAGVTMLTDGQYPGARFRFRRSFSTPIAP